MDVFYPVFTCMLVTSVLICCCVRHRRRRLMRPREPVYVVLPSAPVQQPYQYSVQPSAPPMPIVKEETADPIV